MQAARPDIPEVIDIARRRYSRSRSSGRGEAFSDTPGEQKATPIIIIGVFIAALITFVLAGGYDWSLTTILWVVGISLGSIIILAIAYRMYTGRGQYRKPVLNNVRSISIKGGDRGGGGNGGSSSFGWVKWVFIIVAAYLALAWVGIMPASLNIFSNDGSGFGHSHGILNDWIDNNPDSSGWDVRTVGAFGAIGGVIGFFVGGPAGAFLGAAAGGGGTYLVSIAYNEVSSWF